MRGYLGSLRRSLRCLREVASLEQVVELPDKEVFGTWQVVARGNA